MSEHSLKIMRRPFLDLQSGAKTGEVRSCADRDFQVGDVVLLTLIDDTGNPTGQSLRRSITHIQCGYGLPDDICVLSYAQPSDGALTNEGAEPVVTDNIGGNCWSCKEPVTLMEWVESDGHCPHCDAEIDEAEGIKPAPASITCTCPSGDGSLRWPCPVHPPEMKALVLPDRLMEVLNFLTGTSDLDGFHYGDMHPSGRKFWWRNEVRACLERVKELNS